MDNKICQSGFTLVELLVALALSLIVLSAVSAIFLSQNKSFTDQADVVEMQEASRAGIEMISRELIMAGYIAEAPSDAPDTDKSGETFSDGSANNIEEANLTSIAFEADIDDDDKTETVRYAWSGTAGDSLTREVWEWDSSTGSWGSSAGEQSLIDNIDDLIITYAYNGSGTSLDDIRTITIELTVRTSKPDPDYPDNGGYRTRTLSTVVKPRNLSLDFVSSGTTVASTTTSTTVASTTTSTTEATTTSTTVASTTTSTTEATTTTSTTEATTTSTTEATTTSTTEAPSTTTTTTIPGELHITLSVCKPNGNNKYVYAKVYVTDGSGTPATGAAVTWNIDGVSQGSLSDLGGGYYGGGFSGCSLNNSGRSIDGYGSKWSGTVSAAASKDGYAPDTDSQNI